MRYRKTGLTAALLAVSLMGILTGCSGKKEAAATEPASSAVETQQETAAQPQGSLTAEAVPESAAARMTAQTQEGAAAGTVRESRTEETVSPVQSGESTRTGELPAGSSEETQSAESTAEEIRAESLTETAGIRAESLTETETAGIRAESLTETAAIQAEPLTETSAAAESEMGFAGIGSELESQEAESFRWLVVIDAGHQQHANSEKEPVGPGASETKAKVSSGTAGDYTGVPEYELTLTVALKLRDELEARGYEVLMVRETNDVNISNVERATMANEANAGAFLRIHADGSDSHKAQGCMTICQTPHNPYNADIYPQCRALADAVLEGMAAATGAKNRGVYESDTYSGINWCTVPVTIVEMGFMSNEEEDRLMQTEEYQNQLVQGMANGLDVFFAGQEPPVPVSTEGESGAEETSASGRTSSGETSPVITADETLPAESSVEQTMPETSGAAAAGQPSAQQTAPTNGTSQPSAQQTAPANGTSQPSAQPTSAANGAAQPSAQQTSAAGTAGSR